MKMTIKQIATLLWGAWVVIVPYLFFILGTSRGAAAFLIPIAIILPRELLGQRSWSIMNIWKLIIDMSVLGLGGYVLFQTVLYCFW